MGTHAESWWVWVPWACLSRKSQPHYAPPPPLPSEVTLGRSIHHLHAFSCHADRQLYPCAQHPEETDGRSHGHSCRDLGRAAVRLSAALVPGHFQLQLSSLVSHFTANQQRPRRKSQLSIIAWRRGPCHCPDKARVKGRG